MTAIALHTRSFTNSQRTVVAVGAWPENALQDLLQPFDIHLAAGFSNQLASPTEWEKAIASQNSQHDRWAWRETRPSETLKRLLTQLRNPVVLLGVKSAVNPKAADDDWATKTQRVRQACRQGEKALTFAQSLSVPTLLCSPTAWIHQPEHAREQLAKILSLPQPAETSEETASDQPTQSGGVSTAFQLAFPTEQKTAVILGPGPVGVPVAKALAQLGIAFPGSENGQAADQAIAEAARNKADRGAVRAVLRTRNEAHDRWGFYHPEAAGWLSRFNRWLRNPHYLFLYPDPIHLTRRQEAGDPLAAMQRINRLLVRQTNLMAESRRPLLLTSRAQIAADPLSFVRQVCDFLEVSASTEAQEAAAKLLRWPAAEPYVEVQTAPVVEGVLDPLQDFEIRGWAFELGNPDPVNVEVLLNDQPVAQFTAGQARPGLAKRSQDSGRHGFSYDLRPHVQAGQAYQVSVRAVGQETLLKHAPRTLRT